MKLKHILINILPLPLWIGYYYSTLSGKRLFMMPGDEWLYLMFIIAFTIYNLFSKKIWCFLVRNLLGSVSLTFGCYISGQIYLTYCPHMSDEHYAVKSIPFDLAIEAFVITAIAFVVCCFILKKNKVRKCD